MYNLETIINDTTKELLNLKEKIENIKKELDKKQINTKFFNRLLEDIATFFEIKKQFDEFKLKVPLIGHFSSGKSSLINAVIGVEILDTDIEPKTDRPYEIFYNSQSFEEEIVVEGLPVYKLGFPFENLQSYKNLIIVDLPGFFADNIKVSHDNENTKNIIKNHTKITKIYFTNADFFILVLDASRGSLGKSLKSILLEKKDTPFVVLLHKEDKISSNQKESLKNHIFQELLPLKPYFIDFTSKKNVKAFFKALDIAKDLYPSIKSKKFKHNFIDVVQKIINDLNFLINFSQSYYEELEKYKMELEKEIENFEKNIKDTIESYKISIYNLIRDVKENIRYFLLDENNIDLWAEHLDRYKEDVKDTLDKNISSFLDQLKSYVESLQSKLENQVEDFNIRMKNYSTKNLDVDSPKFNFVIDTMILKLLEDVTKVIFDIKKLSDLSKILKVLKSNIIGILIGIAMDRLVSFFTKRFVKDKIKKQNESIYKEIKLYIDSEIKPEIDKLFSNLETIDIKKNLKDMEEQMKELYENQKVIMSLKNDMENIYDYLKQIKVKLEKVEV